jgi:hypothetical protein
MQAESSVDHAGIPRLLQRLPASRYSQPTSSIRPARKREIDALVRKRAIAAL